MILSKLIGRLNNKYLVKKERAASHTPLDQMIIAVFISMFMAFGIYIITSDIIMSRAFSQFRSDTGEIHKQINNEVHRYQDLLYSSKSFIATTPKITKQTFSNYVYGLDMHNYPALHALNYIELVHPSAVKDYYENLHQEYLQSSEPLELKNQLLNFLKQKEEAALRNPQSEHLIMSYFEPFQPGLIFVGKDFTTDEIGYKMLKKGRETGEINFTGRFIPGKNKKGDDILALFYRAAVFDKYSRENRYKGAVAVGIKLDETLFNRNVTQNSYIRFQIRDKIENENTLIFDSWYPTKKASSELSETDFNSRPLFSHTIPLNIAGRHMEIYAETAQMPPNVAGKHSAKLLALIAFLGGLYVVKQWFGLQSDKGRAYKIAEKMTEEIRVTAYSDSLTGLANRQAFLEDLNNCLTNFPNEPAYVMFMDLDGFKKVNDTLGHAAGDIVLKNFASRLNELAQSEPIKCYRIGGDEFTILLETRTSPIKFKKSHLEELAKNLLLLTKQSFSVAGEDFFLSVSIGIAEYPLDGKTTQELFKNSDVAMYETKRKGKNNYAFYSKELSANLEKKNQMENLLVNALDKNEFYLAFQPKLHRVGEKFLPNGAEVLLRWKNEKLGEVSPFQFIPVAEEAGVMPRLGLWVFEETVKKLADWKLRGIEDIKMSVNLSVHQFSDSKLTQNFNDILTKYGISSEQIIIEITESTMMQDVDGSRGLLKEFRSSGFEVSIDDFGTGYSSLSYLRKFPVNEIKIDRSFTKDVLLDSKDRLVISAIIGLAQNLGLNVVVEGVETKEQLDWFDNQGKLQVQGYYFSKPILEKDFLAFWDNISNS